MMNPGTHARNAAEADPTSTTLVARVKAGEPAAWERFVDLYGGLAYKWARQCGLHAEEAADVVQEVLGAVATHLADFRRLSPGDSLRGWLWTITRNKVRDHFRARRGRPQAEGGSAAQQRLAQIPDRPPESPDEASSGDEGGLAHRVMELVRSGVEDRTWQAFWKVAIDGRSVADVADELGISTGAVYKAKYRVLRRVRDELNDLLQ